MKKHLLILGAFSALTLSSCFVSNPTSQSSQQGDSSSSQTSSGTTSQESETSGTESENQESEKQNIGYRPFTMAKNLTKADEAGKFHPVIADYYFGTTKFGSNCSQYLLYLGRINFVPIEIYSSTYISKEVVPVDMTLHYEKATAVDHTTITKTYTSNSFSKSTMYGGSSSSSASSGESRTTETNLNIGLQYGVASIGGSGKETNSTYSNMSSSNSNHWSVQTSESHTSEFYSFESLTTSESELVDVSFGFTANYEGTYAYGSYVDCEAYVYATISYKDNAIVIQDLTAAYNPIPETKTNGLIYSEAKSQSTTDESIYKTRETDDKLLTISEQYILSLNENDVAQYGEAIEGDFTESDRFTFELNDDETASLTNVSAYHKDEIIRVPSVYNGYPVTEIKSNAFYHNSYVKQVIIPNSVERIGVAAFTGCTGLVSVHVKGSNLKRIGYKAFENCVSLSIVEIPESVEIIDAAFLLCPNLVLTLKDDAFYLGAGNNPYHALVRARSTSIQEIKITQGTVIVGAGIGFKGCQYISNRDTVTIPNGVKCIGDSCFKDVHAGSYVLPDSIIYIGEHAFENNTGLSSITLPNSLEVINKYVFKACTKLSTLTNGSNVKTIDDYAFDGCTALTNVQFAKAESIEMSAFKDCTSLSSVDFPKVKTIDWNAFSGCTSLNNTSFPECEAIYTGAFSGCTALTSFNTHDNLVSIADLAFKGCTSLATFSIGAGLTNLSGSALVGCESLTTIEVYGANTAFKIVNSTLLSKDGTTLVKYPGNLNATSYTIPSSVTKLGEYSFDSASKLTSITVNSGVEIVDMYAFSKCSSLTSIDLPLSVTELGYSAFVGCTSIQSLSVPAIKERLSSSFGDYWSAEVVPETLTSVTLKNQGNPIPVEAFNKCSKIQSITINSNVTATVGYYAFRDCTSLKTVVLPSSVDYIGDAAFENCTSLTSVNIPNDVKKIGEEAFKNCKALTKIVIPTSVTYIEDNAFAGCSVLNIYCRAESRPQSWKEERYWNPNSRPITWGYTGA